MGRLGWGDSISHLQTYILHCRGTVLRHHGSLCTRCQQGSGTTQDPSSEQLRGPRVVQTRVRGLAAVWPWQTEGRPALNTGSGQAPGPLPGHSYALDPYERDLSFPTALLGRTTSCCTQLPAATSAGPPQGPRVSTRPGIHPGTLDGPAAGRDQSPPHKYLSHLHLLRGSPCPCAAAEGQWQSSPRHYLPPRRRMPSALASLGHKGSMAAFLLQAGVFQHISRPLSSPLPFPLHVEGITVPPGTCSYMLHHTSQCRLQLPAWCLPPQKRRNSPQTPPGPEPLVQEIGRRWGNPEMSLD